MMCAKYYRTLVRMMEGGDATERTSEWRVKRWIMMTLLSLYPSNCGNKNTQENIMTIVQLTYGMLPRTTILFLVSCHLQSRHRHHCLHPRIRSCPFDETWRNHAHQTSTSLVQALRRKKAMYAHSHEQKKTKLHKKRPKLMYPILSPKGLLFMI